jgi:hypothetical protein
VSSESTLRYDLASGNFRLTRHALERMAERTVSKADIRKVGSTGVVKLAEDGKFKVTGVDLDGDELSLICVYDHGTLIITVF